MTLENNISYIKNFLLKRYGKNLAAIIIFGSANTGHFVEKKSDIDNMIFLKKKGKINSKKEINFLIKKLKNYNFATQYFYDLKEIKKYIKNKKERGHFSSYITITSKDGSRTIYTTPEFEKIRKYLRKHPLKKDKIKRNIKEKDSFELEEYFKKIKGFNLTKAFMSHLRRKLQVINCLETKKLIFDYEKCLEKIQIDNKEKNKLKKLYNYYAKRKSLTKKEINYYENLAKKLSKKIELL